MKKNKRSGFSNKDIALAREYGVTDTELTNEIYNDIKRSKYAKKVFNNLCAIGKGHTFGAQVCAFVADHPDEAEALAEHHCQSFLAKKQQYMRPQTVNKFIIHNDILIARGNAKSSRLAFDAQKALGIKEVNYNDGPSD